MHSIFSDENLQVFVTVARLASFTKAADELGLTVAAVSYTIKRIESYLGTPIFIRSTRSIELTDAGFYFYRKAESLLYEFRSIEQSMINLDKQVEAKLDICLNNILHTPLHTSTLLNYLKKAFPTCQVDISIEVYNGVWDALTVKNSDIAIGAPGELIKGGGVDSIEIGKINWLFTVPPKHPLALAPEPIPESILKSYPAVFVEDTAMVTIIKKTAWSLRGQETITAPDLDTKYLLLLEGSGIGFLPDFLVKDAIANNCLLVKKITNPRKQTKMLLAVKHDMKGKVVQWIKNEFKPDGKLYNLYKDILHND